MQLLDAFPSSAPVLDLAAVFSAASCSHEDVWYFWITFCAMPSISGSPAGSCELIPAAATHGRKERSSE